MGLKNFSNLTAISKETWFGGSYCMQHKAKIKVDEKGSTAAAATPIITLQSADYYLEYPEPERFICDHSFAYLIIDQKLGEVLFAGVYRGE